ncbi:MAG: DoxX family membrane protein [Bacteroidota bacterium]
MKPIELIARIMYAIPMIMAGVVHFSKSSMVARMVPKYLPAKEVWVYVTGIGFILASIAIIINKKSRIAAISLGVMLLLFALMIHLRGFLKGVPLASSLFLRDISLAGASFFIAAKSKD